MNNNAFNLLETPVVGFSINALNLAQHETTWVSVDPQEAGQDFVTAIEQGYEAVTLVDAFEFVQRRLELAIAWHRHNGRDAMAEKFARALAAVEARSYDVYGLEDGDDEPLCTIISSSDNFDLIAEGMSAIRQHLIG